LQPAQAVVGIKPWMRRSTIAPIPHCASRWNRMDLIAPLLPSEQSYEGENHPRNWSTRERISNRKVWLYHPSNITDPNVMLQGDLEKLQWVSGRAVADHCQQQVACGR
jgi:hypothetical protein